MEPLSTVLCSAYILVTVEAVTTKTRTVVTKSKTDFPVLIL